MEEWKDVVGYEGIYQVSNFGRVKSMGRWVYRYDRVKPAYVKESFMTPSPGKSGHMRVNLRKNLKSETIYVHRLVLEAFVGPCPSGMEGCHKDDDPSNNRLKNLRWDTRHENIEDRRKNGILVIGENATGAKLTADDIVEIRRRVIDEGETQTAVAKHFNLSGSHISNIVNQKVWRHV